MEHPLYQPCVLIALHALIIAQLLKKSLLFCNRL